MTDSLHCPNCGCAIEVSTVLASQMRDQLKRELEVEANRTAAKLGERERQLRAHEHELMALQQDLEQAVSQRLAEEKTRLLKEAEGKAKASLSLQITELQEQLATASQKVDDAQKVELQLRKDRRQLEEQKSELELSVARRLDEERNAIRQTAKNEAVEEGKLREADRDKLIADLRHQIDELKRKSEQGSMQAQGEVMELILEDLLRQYFPLDAIEDVPVGVHGGDVVHSVHDATGEECGKILWESKRTKAWSDAWLPKLRDDQRATKAHVAILVTSELPKSIASFGCIDGVWVTKREYLIGLAIALRAGLLEVAKARRSMQGQQTKMEYLYQFLVGQEFQQRVEGIIEAFATMKEDLDSERRSLHRIWAKREKQIERAMINTSGLYGDLASILGTSLPQIDCLELTHIPVEADETIVEKAPWE